MTAVNEPTVAIALRRRVRRRSRLDRIRTGWREVWRELFFICGMLDEKGNPSLIKMLAVAIVVAGVHGRLVDDEHLTTLDFLFVTLGCFAALGKVGMEMYKEFKTNQQAADITNGVKP